MPVLSARDVGVRLRRRWLFRDVDVTAEPGEVVAVVGPAGSGRTTLLLALARRFRLAAGEVRITGPAALGYVPGVTDPESAFTVAEHVRERLALIGRRDAGVDLHGLDPQTRGRDLSPYERHVLGLVLALLSEPAVIALDGVDDALDATEQARLWQLLMELTGEGTAIVLTARDVDPASVTTVIRLGAEGGDPVDRPAEWAESVESPSGERVERRTEEAGGGGRAELKGSAADVAGGGGRAGVEGSAADVAGGGGRAGVEGSAADVAGGGGRAGVEGSAADVAGGGGRAEVEGSAADV